VVFAAGDPLPVAVRITVKGVTPAAREAEREQERLDRILHPNPTERPRP
jgi:hypothetical protein